MIEKPMNTKNLKGKRTKCFFCDHRNIATEIFLWILTLGIWASIFVVIITDLVNSVIVGCLYIIYLLLELCSNIMDLYSSQKSPYEINELIGRLFKSTPSIEFICEIYITKKYTDSRGKKQEKYIFSHSKTDNLNILSSRDVSGPLNLHSDESHYAILNIQYIINFADTISYSDYKEKRNEIKNYKEFGYKHYEYKEKIKICDTDIDNTYFLINIYGGESCLLAKCAYIISVILTLGQLYKLILFCLTNQITFIIKKIISTRYDLTCDVKYDPYNPKLIFPTKTFKYKKNDICHVDKNIKIKPPTLEELTESLQYKDFIPQFGENKSINGIFVKVNNEYHQNYDNSNIVPIKNLLYQSVKNSNSINETNIGINVNENI